MDGTITLNGRWINVDIREIKREDAKQYLTLCQQLDEETQYMLFEPGERDLSIQEQEEKIEHILLQKHSTILVADNGEQIIGFIAVLGNQLKRTLHRASIVIGILKDYQGQGMGKQLMAAAEAWAQERGIRRLELTVMSHNKQALWLYSAFNYNVEGIRRKALIVDNRFVDEFYMGKMLPTAAQGIQ